MNILYLDFDKGVVAPARAEAINRYTDSEAHIFYTPMYRDEEERDKMRAAGILEEKSKELDEVVEWADVIHVCNTEPTIWNVDSLDNVVFEYYGGYARMCSSVLLEWQTAKMKPVISSPELGRHLLRWHYIPVPMDVQGTKLAKRWYKPHSPLRVIQTPSRRDYKDTNVFIEACRKLHKEVDMVLVEDEPLEVSLKEKGRADIYFGSMCVGDFGQSEREALAMGLGVVMRLQPIVKMYNPGCPIVDVSSVDGLVAALRRLATDEEACTALKIASRQWAEDFFDLEAVAPIQEAFYEYVLYGDPGYDEWYKPYADIWMKVAREDHGMEHFLNIQGLRW